MSKTLLNSNESVGCRIYCICTASIKDDTKNNILFALRFVTTNVLKSLNNCGSL